LNNLKRNNMTAVEWLIFHWMELDYQYYSGEIGRIDYRNKRDSIQVEAKEMEKKQIIDAIDVAQRTDFYVKYESSEHYYNETFKKK